MATTGKRQLRVLCVTQTPLKYEKFIGNTVRNLAEAGVDIGVLFTRRLPAERTGLKTIRVAYDEMGTWNNLWLTLWPLIYLLSAFSKAFALPFAEAIAEVAGWSRNGRAYGTLRVCRFLIAVWRCWRFSPDVIHVHFGWNLEAALPIAGVLKRPAVLTVHGSDGLMHDDWFRYLRDARLKHIICVSRHLKTTLEASPAFRGFGGGIEVVHNGIDQLFFEDTNPAPGNIAIVCVAALRPLKNHEWLFRALKRLRDNGIDFRCSLVGGALAYADYGEEKNKLAAIASDLGISDRIGFLGRVSAQEVRASLDASSVLVLPSRSEGLPLCLIEAMARKRPVVASDISGCREATRDGRYGRLVQIDDVPALAEAIVAQHAIVQQSCSFLDEARQYALDEFSFDRCVENLLRIYRSVSSE